MRITVTEEHIRAGERADCRECPIAIAAREATGEYAQIFPMVGFVGGKPYSLPPSVNDFIRDFDEGKPVHPFSFDLPLDAFPVDG